MKMNQNKSIKQYREKARELVKQMTLEEKAGLCSGSDFWCTKEVERLGVHKLQFSDGPHGLRVQKEDSDHLGVNESEPATCFPAASTTACSFDRELMKQLGIALGEECQEQGIGVVLGPAANIKRNPLCGRNFEYISEDPYLVGEMASSFIQGVQSQGIGTSMKHFAVNNQETKRMIVSSMVDERALREIYLAGFETAVKQAQPWTMMCAYNRINEVHCSENKKLLSDILRDEWGFEGLVVTDWSAIVDRVQGCRAGVDIEMPYSGPFNDLAIVEAVQNKELDEKILDQIAENVTCLLLAAQGSRKENAAYDRDAHHQLARIAAAQSAVLLKNQDELLPIQRNQKIAVLGQFAEKPRYQGAGSSKVNVWRLDNLCQCLEDYGVEYAYAQGYDCKETGLNETLLKEAVDTAKKSEIAVVCIGLPDLYESEGFDRDHMKLPESHIRLVEEVAKVNPNVIVLMQGGSAVEMPWIDSAKSILMLYLGGQAGAQAAVDLLFGDVNPSGKLAETFPIKLEDNSSYAYFPGGDNTVEYRESIYVGYRYYDKANVPVRFPFGFGLSYTTFEYRNLQAEKGTDGVKVSVTVKNTGKCAGAEIVQFYVSQKNPSVFKPVRELKEFVKVYLEPGEEHLVSVLLPDRAFSYYNTDKKDWCMEEGTYVIEAAASSRDICCIAEIELEGEKAQIKKDPDEYWNPSYPLRISKETFETLCGRKMPPMDWQPTDPYTINSTSVHLSRTPEGIALLGQLLQGADAQMTPVEDEGMARLMERASQETPLRVMMSFGGQIGMKQLREIVDQLNQARQQNDIQG